MSANGNQSNDQQRLFLESAGADRQGEPPTATVIDARPAALVDGVQIPWGLLRPIMTEAVGASALQEVMLNRAVDQLAEQAGIAIDSAALGSERTLLLEQLHDDRATALRLLDDFRAARGLGSTRFASLLRRNAILRRAVQPDVDVSAQAVQRMFEIIHGPKRQARLILTADLADAQEALDRIRAGASFDAVAMERSIDTSAARGGLLEPIARNDPTYPDAVRAQMWRMTVGQMSNPVFVDGAYAVLQLHRTYPADDVAFADVRQDMATIVRLEQERLLMDQRADELLRNKTVHVIDASLAESWKRRAK